MREIVKEVSGYVYPNLRDVGDESRNETYQDTEEDMDQLGVRIYL